MSENVCNAILSMYAAMASDSSAPGDSGCRTPLLRSTMPRLALEATAGVWLLEEAVEFVTASDSPSRADAVLDMLGVIIAYISITGRSAALGALKDFNQFQYDRGRPVNNDANNIMKILIGIADRPEAEADAIRMLERRAQSPQKECMSHALEGALRTAEAKRGARGSCTFTKLPPAARRHCTAPVLLSVRSTHKEAIMANDNDVNKMVSNSITPGGNVVVDSDHEIRRYTMSQQVRRLEATLISDADVGSKPAVVGLFDSARGVGAWRDSAHQGHLVELSVEYFEYEGEPVPRARLIVHVVEEIHPTHAFQSRTLKFGELVHLLLNITDDEIKTIIARVDPAEEQRQPEKSERG